MLVMRGVRLDSPAWANSSRFPWSMSRGPGTEPRRRSGADDEGWSRDERRLVDYLRSLGHEVVRIPESSAHGVKSADALVDMVPTEFKTIASNEVRSTRGHPPASVNSLVNAANRSEDQASSAIVDARNVPLTRAAAEEALRRLKGSPQISSDRIRYVGRDFDIVGDVK